jgi:predicted amidohydrolase
MAVAQVEPLIGQVERNVATIETQLADAVRAGARLCAFLDCAVTRYIFAPARPTGPCKVRTTAAHMPAGRALENRVFVLTSNRIGCERNAEFSGWSQTVGVTGERLVEADHPGEALLAAEVDPAEARIRDMVPEPGEHEMSLYGHRRPEYHRAPVDEPAVVNQR